MEVMTVQSYIMVTMMYGICMVLVISRACHYVLFFVAALSITTLLHYVVVLVISGEQ